MRRIAFFTIFAGCLTWTLTLAGQQRPDGEEETRPQRQTRQKQLGPASRQTKQLWDQIARNHKQIVEAEVAAARGSSGIRRGVNPDPTERQKDGRLEQRPQENDRPGQTGQQRQDRRRGTAVDSRHEQLWQQIAQVHQQIVALQLAHANRGESGREREVQQKEQAQQQSQQKPGQSTDQAEEQMKQLILRLGLLHQQAIVLDMADALKDGDSQRRPRIGREDKDQPRRE